MNTDITNHKLRKYAKNCLFIALFGLILVIFHLSDLTKEEIKDIRTNLVSSVGIIVAILFAYFLNQITIIQQNRKLAQNKIKPLASKLVFFQMFINNLRNYHPEITNENSDAFWVNFHLMNYFNHRFPNLSYQESRKYSFYLPQIDMEFRIHDDYNIPSVPVTLALILNDICLSSNWYSTKYTKEKLENMRESLGEIWYYFDNRYEKHGIYGINNTPIKLSAIFRGDDSEEHIKKFGLYYNKFLKIKRLDHYTEISRIDIAKISNHVKYSILSDMVVLQEDIERVLPQKDKFLLKLLVILFCTGLIIPLTISYFDKFDTDNIYIFLFSLSLTLLSYIIFEMYLILMDYTSIKK